MYKCKHFKGYELVSRKVWGKYGDNVWQFFDEGILKDLDKLREILGKPITVNNWYWGGKFQQRGLRTNIDEMVFEKSKKGIIYCSSHCFGRAFDFDVAGMTAKEVRDFIIKNQKLFPSITYMEDNVNWVHIDSRQSIYKKIYLFAV